MALRRGNLGQANALVAPLDFPGQGPRTYDHVGRLGSLCPLDHLKFHDVTFPQSAVPLCNNRCVVHKDVRAVTASDEAISLGIVEPFHIAKHFCSSLNRTSTAKLNVSVEPGILARLLSGSQHPSA